MIYTQPTKELESSVENIRAATATTVCSVEDVQILIWRIEQFAAAGNSAEDVLAFARWIEQSMAAGYGVEGIRATARALTQNANTICSFELQEATRYIEAAHGVEYRALSAGAEEESRKGRNRGEQIEKGGPLRAVAGVETLYIRAY